MVICGYWQIYTLEDQVKPSRFLHLPLLCQGFFFFFSFFSLLLFVNLNPVCWKNEGSSRPGSSGANCLKFFLLAKVFCNALQNSSRIALLALDVLCGLDTAGSFNEVLVCWRIRLSPWLQGVFYPRSLFVELFFLPHEQDLALSHAEWTGSCSGSRYWSWCANPAVCSWLFMAALPCAGGLSITQAHQNSLSCFSSSHAV